MTTFQLKDFNQLGSFKGPVIINLPKDMTELTKDLQEFPAFKTWSETLEANLALQYTQEDHQFHKDPYQLRSVTVQSVDRWGPKNKLGFVKINADIKTEDGKSFLPGIALLRGGSVAMLMIIRPIDSPGEKLVVLTEQSRAAAGSLSFLEIPAGMVDDSKTFKLCCRQGNRGGDRTQSQI
jgi:hypothetical protein